MIGSPAKSDGSRTDEMMVSTGHSSALARAFDANWRAFVALRSPEAAGMLIGQLLLMAVLLLAGGGALGSRAETS